MKTLMGWGLSLDESVFADGEDKGAVLKAFGAHIYFDDTKRHVDSAVRHLVPAGRVLSGVAEVAASVMQSNENCVVNG